MNKIADKKEGEQEQTQTQQPIQSLTITLKVEKNILQPIITDPKGVITKGMLLEIFRAASTQILSEKV